LRAGRAAAVPAAAQAATPAGIQETVVLGGLNAPRHLVLTRAGFVVTEAGTGGPVGTSNCATGPSTEGAGTTPYFTGQQSITLLVRSNHNCINECQQSNYQHACCQGFDTLSDPFAGSGGFGKCYQLASNQRHNGDADACRDDCL
jgi:hypothetical protein